MFISRALSGEKVEWEKGGRVGCLYIHHNGSHDTHVDLLMTAYSVSCNVALLLDGNLIYSKKEASVIPELWIIKIGYFFR